ncbi:hypothetical protein E2C01_061489 [Portunus trituberculatus]|uniref:Uncharacterized protein n=1 Tax=Portunus trituberculatus TaxID=210409 RepID=A0A5B7HBE7_PORTR|nr:hypothetical protein [Portunus trituberculatus]
MSLGWFLPARYGASRRQDVVERSARPCAELGPVQQLSGGRPAAGRTAVTAPVPSETCAAQGVGPRVATVPRRLFLRR